ncbi:MAG TPA: helix-turn-helix domain-containing protein [Candidatus Baltobacteraceae bacterium]
MDEPESEKLFKDATDALAWIREYGLDACEKDDRADVERALSLIPISKRSSDPACLAVRAALKRYEGHIDKALELYERASVSAAGDSHLRAQIAENLGVLRFLRKETIEAEKIVESALSATPDYSPLIALRATFRAHRGDSRARADIDAVEQSALLLPDLWRARSFIRTCHAAYILGDIPDAEKYAHLAVESAEAAGASRQAATAYQILMSIYSNYVGDVALSLHYADMCADAATKAGDKTQWLIALVSRYGLAAEIGDRALAGDLRAQLEPLRAAEKYGERFVIVFADALYYSWTLAFDTMRQYLGAVSLGRIGDAQRAICHGLRAVAASGCGDEEEALQYAYRALSMARPTAKESVFETRLRLLARVMGATVLMRANRKSEAMRMFHAFSHRMTLSVRRLMQAVVDDNYEPLRDTAPDLVGYGMMFQALQQAEAQIYESTVRLTKRETEILHACAAGETARMIGQKLGIDEATVVWHRNNILKKLGVNRTIAAIAKGRVLRLIP